MKPQRAVTSHPPERCDQRTSAGEDVGKVPRALSVGVQTGAATTVGSSRISSKNKNGTASWPSDPTPSSASREPRNTGPKAHTHPRFTATLLTADKARKQPECPSAHGQVKKQHISTRECSVATHSSSLALNNHDNKCGPKDKDSSRLGPVSAPRLPGPAAGARCARWPALTEPLRAVPSLLRGG